MHELSLATDVINLVTEEAKKNGVSLVREILIEVGDLSGVEADAFQWALELLIKETILKDAEVRLLRTPGTGFCKACEREFEMRNRLDICPRCGSFPSEIRGGQEFRVVSMTGE
ncbi:MAG: hydrogenase maturation nickel metallochaperone HypA [Bacteroidetes bacterium]|nr:hydrogenase maturation nickel metallochaperone HypA [Bacteroidota bacterium]